MPSLRQFEGGPSGGASGGASRGASSRVKNLSAVLSWPATFKPARVYQLAITRAIANPECRRLLLKALSVDVLVSMENPVEVCLWFQEEWEHRDDLNESLWIVQRLYDCVANAELQSRAVSYDPSKVCDIVYEVFSVALFSCEDRDIILDIMERLLVVFNQKQLVYFFKKALMIAVDAPTPAAIWCITFANVILMKAPDIIIPMIHVNPTWNDLVDIRAPLCAPVSMPASLPEATSESLEQTPILETQLRTAQLCCFELQLLKHHASPAIRYAAQNLTSSLNDPTAPSHAKTCSFFMRQIEHNVLQNDTLGTIASKYNVSIQSIKAINRLRNNEVRIHPSGPVHMSPKPSHISLTNHSNARNNVLITVNKSLPPLNRYGHERA
ncbi:carbohydrate-binding module family 50 protein [Gregarina niphandrodes]|uniref:Carbohydrate-binding module family 50 protein n=1 Tax=Gregarina niphandrodes TaxID=110365 RepID=A0A023B6C6_GRENI|nr:carbohydrate-binding module family 50 protein [Gregarina niphandrodes]EZG66174.1 carbohydrate-binding module family 50 protein [Gregarina niphandrodes]|eukprot:XP_011134015.1 carbohydrate-binding module family 50 protein [Gregarina niphandrodes]